MRDPDVIWRTLQLAMNACPALTLDVARTVERDSRDEFGGLRVQVPVTPYRPDRGPGHPPLPIDKQRAVFSAALTNVSMSTLVHQYGVSRATIYRLLKRGPR